MARKHPPYSPEFRRQMIELVRAGRRPEELAKEFETPAQAIHNWVAQADRDEGRREDGLTTAERDELSRLRRENRQLKLEREILSNQTSADRVRLWHRNGQSLYSAAEVSDRPLFGGSRPRSQ